MYYCAESILTSVLVLITFCFLSRKLLLLLTLIPKIPNIPKFQSHTVCWPVCGLNQESYRGVAHHFNIRQSMSMKHLHNFRSLVNIPFGHLISGPVGDALRQSGLGFAQAAFPGAVDGRHIPIQKPQSINPIAYLNLYLYSVSLTAFCDSASSHISVGHPGSCHDADTLHRAPQTLMPQGRFTRGDSAYPLLPHLMKP